MKLRVRSLETKQTLRLSIPDSSPLLDLQSLISSTISSPSSSSICPQSIILSLNQTTPLLPSSPTDSLLSLGLTSGDLLYYSIQEVVPGPTQISNTEPQPPQLMEVVVEAGPTQSETTLIPELPPQEMEVEIEEEKTLPPPAVPTFLKRVMELSQDGFHVNPALSVVAFVHSILLESGFVDFNKSNSPLLKTCNLEDPSFSIHYTLPELLGFNDGVETAVLKFSKMGKHVTVYGILGGHAFRVCLDASNVAGLLVSGVDEKVVFGLWKEVKDKLCLPLLIDICQKNGLPLPPCFDRLPTELKVRVLEVLPGVDVAKVGCTSLELKYVASNDEIWKRKFKEEFGSANEREVAAVSSWKKKFELLWKKRKEEREKTERMDLYARNALFAPRYNPPFAPQRFPMVGGDYDRLPAIGGGFGLQRPQLRFPNLPARRNFSPHCNLGEHGYDDDLIG